MGVSQSSGASSFLGGPKCWIPAGCPSNTNPKQGVCRKRRRPILRKTTYMVPQTLDRPLVKGQTIYFPSLNRTTPSQPCVCCMIQREAPSKKGEKKTNNDDKQTSKQTNKQTCHLKVRCPPKKGSRLLDLAFPLGGGPSRVQQADSQLERGRFRSRAESRAKMSRAAFTCSLAGELRRGLIRPTRGRPIFAKVEREPELGPPVERLEEGYLICCVLCFSRGTLPRKRVKGHYSGT